MDAVSAPYDPAVLERMLRAQVVGYPPGEAAIGLLAEHGFWLAHRTFVKYCVSVETDPDLVGQTPMAFIDWSGTVAGLDVHGFRCSGSEAQVMRIAAALAGRVPIDLRDAVTGLGPNTLAMVLRALAHAAGHQHAEVRLR